MTEVDPAWLVFLAGSDKGGNVSAGYVESELPKLRVGSDWVEVDVVSEVLVRYVARTYVPCLIVHRGPLAHVLYAGAMSLAQPLEEERSRRNGTLTGVRMRLHKKGTERSSPYEVEFLK